jgi:hypothetical protein
MIDVGGFIKQEFQGEQLKTYLLEEDAGGISTEFLKCITKLPSYEKYLSLFSYHVFVWLYSLPISFRTKVFACYSYMGFLFTTDAPMFEMHRQIILENLKAGRPALVSNFQVDSKFEKGGVSFAGQIDYQSNPESHAMLLIGHLTKTDGDWFLLQNWWHKRFFIEVSSTYLASAGATITGPT